jgi:hypothetical protein
VVTACLSPPRQSDHAVGLRAGGLAAFGIASESLDTLAVYLGLTSDNDAVFYDPGAPDRSLPLTYPLAELTHFVGVIGAASRSKPYRGLDSYPFPAAQLPTVESWESDLLKVPVPAFDRGGLVRFPLPESRSVH